MNMLGFFLATHDMMLYNIQASRPLSPNLVWGGRGAEGVKKSVFASNRAAPYRNGEEKVSSNNHSHCIVKSFFSPCTCVQSVQLFVRAFALCLWRFLLLECGMRRLGDTPPVAKKLSL